MSAPAEPVAEADRDRVVDVVRGVALLGIAVVNVAAYRVGVAPTLSAGGGRNGGVVDGFTVGLASLTEGRFYPLFSLLFGWGFATMDARARARGASVLGPWLRRALALWALGVVHALFFFDGDILVSYALLGLGLLAVRTLRAGTVAAIGAGVVLGQALFTAGVEAFIAALSSGTRAEAVADLADERAVYSSGAFLDVVGDRAATTLLDVPFGFLFNGGTILGMMLLGVAAGQAGWSDPRRWPPWLRRGAVPLWLGGLVLGVPGAWALADQVVVLDDPGMAALGRLSYQVLGPLVALGWAAVLVLAARSRIKGALAPIAAAGRMSLTCYLGQSVVASLVFNGYGLGWGDRVGLGGAVAMITVFWAVQVVTATLWFRVFRMGPLEWLVRWFGYLHRPPLRRRQVGS